MPQAQTLPALVRAKYPGIYDDLSDTDLDAKVRAKFPGVYDDLPKPATTAGVSDWSKQLGLHEPTTSRVKGFFRGAGTAAVDIAEGAASGLATGIVQGGDIIRRLTNQPRIIDEPDVQELMRAPATIQGTIGRLAEQGAEFAVPLARIANAKALPLALRLGLESAASAGVAGVQTGGDPTAMTVAAAFPPAGAVVSKTGQGLARIVKGAAAGAGEGGMGGAVASIVRSTAPSDSKTMIVQALKPRNTRINFVKSLDRSLPELKAVEDQIGKPITSLDELLPAVKIAKRNVRAQYDTMAGPRRAQGSTVDLSPVADAMEASIPSKVKLQSPGQAESIQNMAAPYRDRFSLEDAEQLLRETNAELQAYYNKFPAAQRTTELANPEIAHLVAQAKALRSAIYRTLDNPGQGKAAMEVQRRYGALMEIEDAALRRSNVAARQQPESLSEQIGKVRAAADMARGVWRISHGDLTGAADIAAAKMGKATATYLKEQQTTDTLIRRAFAAHKGRPVPVEMPGPPRPVAGLLGPGPIITPPPADTSYVRAVRGEYAEKIPAIVEKPNVPKLSPETPTGIVPSRGGTEPYGSQGGGLQPAAKRPNRGQVGPNTRAIREAEVARYEQDTLDSLVSQASEAGYGGDPASLRAELSSHLQDFKDLHAELADSGRNGITLLRAIKKGGGISVTRETGMKGEIRHLKWFEDTKPSASRKNLQASPVRISGQVKGVPGVFRDRDGLTLDGMVEYLGQDQRFSHIKSINDLLAAIEKAATDEVGASDALDSLASWVNSNDWRKHVTATAADVIDSFDPAQLENLKP